MWAVSAAEHCLWHDLLSSVCFSMQGAVHMMTALLPMRQGLAYWLDVCEIHATPAAVLGSSAQCFPTLFTAVLGMVLLGAPLGAYCA